MLNAPLQHIASSLQQVKANKVFDGKPTEGEVNTASTSNWLKATLGAVVQGLSEVALVP